MRRAIASLKKEYLECYQRSGYRKHEGEALHYALESPRYEIRSIEFETSSAKEIRQQALAPIRSSQIYRRGRVPARFGLLDMRMGSRDPRFRCATCGESSSSCNGHPGSLDLCMPVYNPHYLKFVQCILQSICVCCMRPRISKSNATYAHPKSGICAHAIRFKDQTRCSHADCGAFHPTYKKCSNTYILRTWTARAKKYLRMMLAEKDPARLKNLLMPLRAVEVHDTFSVMETMGYASELRSVAGQGLGSVSFFPSLLFDALPVSPVSLRPTVILSVGSKLRSESEQTIVYQAIVKENAKLLRMMLTRARAGKLNGAATSTGTHSCVSSPHSYMDQTKFRETYDVLQAIVSMFVSASAKAHNPSISRRRRSGENRRSLSSYLTGKTGLLRSNVQGKRGNNGARTVITGDPHIPVDVVTVPEFIATRLHRTEPVTRFNLSKMRERVLKGPGTVGGAYKVLLPRSENHTKRLSYALWRTDRKAIARVLAPGYSIVRYLETGDRVLFNRQPSLSRKSLMAFRVRVIEDEKSKLKGKNRIPRMPRTVFGMHLSVTTAFNADFDGDEMNIHLLNSYEAEAEGEYLVSVNRQVTNELNSKTTLCIVQDSVLGAYLLSCDNQWFTRAEYMQLVSQATDTPYLVPTPAGTSRWSGKQVLSSFMPPISINTNTITIQNGMIITGHVTKHVLNGGFESILYKTAHYCGDNRAVLFAEDLQRVTRVFLSWRGGQVAIGPDNLMSCTNTEKRQQQSRMAAVREACAWGQKIIDVGLQERIQPHILEADAQSHFGTLLHMDKMARNCHSLQYYAQNALEVVVDSGSKGSWINLSQMRTCVGQQSQNGSRMTVLDADAPDDPRLSSHEFAPTSPCRHTHSHTDDQGLVDLVDRLEPWSDTAGSALRQTPRARGFVVSSFRDGLGMAEFFYHSMSGRVGVIDTSCKTAESGYLQRKLSKALEDLVVAYDYTVRDVSCDAVISFLYGEGDGLDPKRVCVTNKLPLHEHSNSDVKSKCRKAACVMCTRWKVLCSEMRTTRQRDISMIQKGGDAESIKYGLPFEPACLWRQICDGPVYPSSEEKMASRAFVERHLGRLLHFLRHSGERVLFPRVGVLGEVSAGGPLRAGSKSTHLALRISVAHHMCPSRILPTTESKILEFVSRAQHHFFRALISPGDSVGASAATSLGASLTQSTLNTFHFAGVAEKRAMTLGIPRYKELVNASHNISNAYVDIHFTLPPPSFPVLKNTFLHAEADASMVRLLWPQVNLTMEDGSIVKSLPAHKHDFNIWDTCIRKKEWAVPTRKRARGRRNRTNVPDRQPNRFIFVGHLHASAPTAEELCRRIRCGLPWGKDSNIPDLDLHWTGQTITAELRYASQTVSSDQIDCENKYRWADACALRDIFEDLIRIPGASPVNLHLGAKTAWISSQGSIRVLMSGVGRGKHSHKDGGGVSLDRAMQNLWLTCHKRGLVFDFRKSYSNDIHAICGTLGVEAARSVIQREFSTVLCSDGTYISTRHVVLASDFMTSRGLYTGMTRHDYKRNFRHRGPIARACFEQPVEVFVDAAASQCRDSVETASARVMVGKRVKNGTGSFSIMTDAEYANIASKYGQSAIPPSPLFQKRRDTPPLTRCDHDDRRRNANKQCIQAETIQSWSSSYFGGDAKHVSTLSKSAVPAQNTEHRGRKRYRRVATNQRKAHPRQPNQCTVHENALNDEYKQRVMREYSKLYTYENLMQSAHMSFAQSHSTTPIASVQGRQVCSSGYSWLTNDLGTDMKVNGFTGQANDNVVSQDRAEFLTDAYGHPHTILANASVSLSSRTRAHEPTQFDRDTEGDDAFGIQSALQCADRASTAHLK